MMRRVGGNGPLLVGNGQAFWGDTIDGPIRLVRGGPLHYLTLDYLAEVTMSILQKARARDPRAGYAGDFVTLLEQILPECIERGVRIVANAGGVNPRGCADAVETLARRLGCHGLRIGLVEGDDLMSRLEALTATGERFTNLDTGEDLGPNASRVQSANAYLGAWPIVEALSGGADIVITGRCTDASLTVAPLAYEFDWAPDDYDKLAAATIAGHIIECGAQCTGGNYEGWREVAMWEPMGFPIVEAWPDGSFEVTKHAGTGGLITRDTVIAQILYEIGDPRRYLTADAAVDFTSIELRDVGPDRVRVAGARGAAPTDSYKVSATLRAGYKAVGQLTVAGPDAVEKAALAAKILFDRLASTGVHFAEHERVVECLGAGVCLAPGDPLARSSTPPEVVLRVAVQSQNRAACDRFGTEVASLLTGGPPGLTGFAGGRPKSSDVLEHWPALVARAQVAATVEVREVGP